MKARNKKLKQNRWTRDHVKEDYWRKQLALWQASGLSVRAFCREHGVVETSFYAWRRELIIRARETGESDGITEEQRVTPNTLKDGRGRTIPVRYRQSDQQPLASSLGQVTNPNPFVPLRIVETGQETEPPPAIEEFEPLKREPVEIGLPGGATIRLNAHADMRQVVELLTMLKERADD